MELATIAERVYYRDGQPDEPILHLQVIRPNELENGHCRCRYRLVVAEQTKEMDIAGIDTMQCLSLCLIMAGTEIAKLNESIYQGALRWAGGTDLGLPTIETAPETKDLYQEALRWSLDQPSSLGGKDEA